MPRIRTVEKLLPRAVAVLGELGPICVFDPVRYQYSDVPYKAGGVLCASTDGREGFVLRPMADGGPVAELRAQALHALHLHKRFMHREADAFWNCVVPRFCRPVYRGQLAILHYYADKAVGAPDGVKEWVHFFERPGEYPAFPDVWTVGHGQLYIGRGEWFVGPQGIDWHRR